MSNRTERFGPALRASILTATGLIGAGLDIGLFLLVQWLRS